MLYDPEKILKDTIDIIERDDDILFIGDIIAELPCSRTVFYEFFPGNSEEMELIRKHLEKNRIAKKKKMRKNWGKEDSHWVLQISLYKLICTDDEYDRLSPQNKNNQESLQPVSINILEQGGNDSIED